MALKTLVVDMDKPLEEGLEIWVTCAVHSSLSFTGV
jgi:hypothetical protein